MVKASDVAEAFRHAFGVEDEAIYRLYSMPYQGLAWALEWLVNNSQYARYWRIVRGLLPSQLVSSMNCLSIMSSLNSLIGIAGVPSGRMIGTWP
ncbi:hypothetical protein [Vulcanisaeta souniana]|uniref:hypothetical protein n=1 Tax=Vulcanisaeta souniana TaxID=164452 RepID=UPI0006D1B82E|nr:hypothetical protein [Vulcanisaeta souniana]